MSGTDTWALPFQRLPMVQSKKEVRLVEFHFEGGGDGDLNKALDMDEEAKRPISLRMVKASLLKPPKFRALSYVWGPSKQDRRITLQVPQKEVRNIDPVNDVAAAAEKEMLESCEIEVTDNLFSALIHYRLMSSTEQTAYFWIDALCINQRDNDEKNWQVAMMRDIYRSAHLVMAWLGPYPKPVSFQLADFMDTLAALSYDALARFGDVICVPPTAPSTAVDTGVVDKGIVEWVRRVCIHGGPFSRADTNRTYGISKLALSAFLNLAFWKRVWILQEVILANEILFTWSMWTMSSERLFAAVRIIEKSIQVTGIRRPLSYTLGIFDTLPSEKSWVRATNAQELPLSPMLNRRHDEAQTNGLWDLIHWSATRGALQATMPADHVFGLLGVANDVEELGVRLDFSRDVADIYTELTSSCIKQKGLVVIADVQWPKKVASLPSWVPDWSALSSTGIRTGIWSSHGPPPDFIPKSGVGNNAGSRAYRLTVSSTGFPALVVGGNTITTVQSFLPSMRDANERNPRLIRRIWNIQSKLLAAKDTIEQSATAYRTVKDRHTAFASTIVAGGWERGPESFEDQWSLGKLVEGYKLLLEPLSAEMSFNALWRHELPFRQMKFHAINTLGLLKAQIAELGFEEDPDDWIAAKSRRLPGLYYRKAFDDFADQVLDRFENDEGANNTIARIATFLDRMEEVGRGRRLFLSADGYLGLGSTEMQNGDVVAYLDSAEVPFILRPLSTGDFTLVGEAYVYGLMDRDAKNDLSNGMFSFAGPSPEVGRTIHQCPEGERREFVIV